MDSGLAARTMSIDGKRNPMFIPTIVIEGIEPLQAEFMHTTSTLVATTWYQVHHKRVHKYTDIN